MIISSDLLISTAVSYLEEDKSTKTQHFSLHGASEVSFFPEVNSGEDVCQANQPAPHTMSPFHVEDKLKLWQSHVMVQSKQTKHIIIPN